MIGSVQCNNALEETDLAKMSELRSARFRLILKIMSGMIRVTP